MRTNVETDGVATIIPPNPEDFFVERSKDLLKMAGVNYRSETLIRAATAIKRA